MDRSTKIKKLFKNLVIVVVGILVVISIYDMFQPKSLGLTITTVPNDATIKINDKEVGTGNYSASLPRGQYSLLVTKSGFNSDVRNISLDRKTTLQISLTPDISINSGLTTLRTVGLGDPANFPNTGIIGVDLANGNLLATENGQSKIVYQGKVRDFSVSKNIAVVLDNRNFSEVVIVDLNTNSSRKLNLSAYSPVISIALSEDGQTLFFLAKFDLEHKSPVLYSININGGSENKIIETNALRVDYLKDNRVLLYEDVHALDQGKVHIIDIESKSEMFTQVANSYLLSPDKSKLLLQTSKALSIVNLSDFKSTSTGITIGDFAAWKDDTSLVILRNRGGSIEYATSSVDPVTISGYSKIINGKQVRNFYGIEGGKIVFQELNDEVLTINLPQ